MFIIDISFSAEQCYGVNLYKYLVNYPLTKPLESWIKDQFDSEIRYNNNYSDSYTSIRIYKYQHEDQLKFDENWYLNEDPKYQSKKLDTLLFYHPFIGSKTTRIH